MSATDMLSGVGGQGLNEVGIAVLKKAQDMEAAGAAQLVAQLPEPSRAGSPAGVGRKADFVA